MRILLVEDDDRIADSLAEALGDQHYVIDIAPDGQPALLRAAPSFQVLDFLLLKLQVMLA